MRKIVLIAVAMLGCMCAKAQERAFLPPTMGWSSWNTYHAEISEKLIKSQADAAVEKGFKDAGYNFINIDDGFFYNREESGRLIIHPTRFPNGLRPVVDYIHEKGLLAGTYSDAGKNTCASMYAGETGGKGAGLYGHDQIDLEMYFKEMDFDFIKVDYCGAGDQGLDHKERYTEIANAIKAATPEGKSIVFNVCCWNYPGTWVHDIADSWRTTEDIVSKWSAYGGVKEIIAQNLYLSAYCSDGHYNDMDMLEVGVTRDGKLNANETFTHFAMWCIMSSPLLIGCDMSKISEDDRDLLCNAELIALNQDPLGIQAYVAKNLGGAYVLVKDVEQLHGLKRAVAFYNPTDGKKTMSIKFKDIDLAGDVVIRDLGERANVGTFQDGYEVEVPAHGTKIYTFTAAERRVRRLYEAETAWLTDYQEISNNQAIGTANYEADSNCSGGMMVGWLGKRETNDLQWRDVYVIEEADYEITLNVKTGEDRTVYISVNGGEPTPVVCNSGGWGKWAEVTTTIHLSAGSNVVRLYNADGYMPDIDYMRIKVGDEETEPDDPNPVDPYGVCTTAQGNNDSSYGRKTTEIYLTTAEGKQTIATGQNSSSAAIFWNLSETAEFTCNPSEQVTPGTNFNGKWMHHYVFVDEDGDGFDGAVDPETHMPAEGSDLKSFSYYGGYNSLGEGNQSNEKNLPLPAFTAPAKPGKYRMRYKTDWDSVDPKGTEKDINKGGIICDVTLVVKGDDDAIQLITPTTATTNPPAYDLSGRRTTKGLQIVNGKKVVK